MGALLSGLFDVLPEPFLAVFEFNERRCMASACASDTFWFSCASRSKTSCSGTQRLVCEPKLFCAEND